MSAPEETALTRLEEALAALSEKGLSWEGTSEFAVWRQTAEAALRRLFGKESRNLGRFLVIPWGPVFRSNRTSQADRDKAFLASLEAARALLAASIQEYRDYALPGESEPPNETGELGFQQLLHPLIVEHALPQFLNGHFRDAVLNALVAVFDLLRSRTGLDLDGQALVNAALSLERPRLLVGDITTSSGKSAQLGFMELLRGAYAGIRNPKAHSLRETPTKEIAAQYLVFASLLARRVAEAAPPN